MPLVKRTSPESAAVTGELPLETLLENLTSGSAASRRGAARGLATHPAAAAALATALEAESDPSVREAIFTAEIRIGSAAAAAGLFPLLNSEDVGLRNGAIEALKTMPDAVTAQIDELLAGPSDVRIFAVEILGALASSSSPARLMRVLEADPELNVCAAAVEAIVECGDAGCAPALEALAQRFPDEPYLQFSIRTALARIVSA